MPEAKHGNPMSLSSFSSPLVEIFTRNADQWFAAQAALLADMDVLTHAWLRRRREGVDAMQHAIQQMTECQEPAEMLHIQQEWLAGVFRRATEDIAALNTGISATAKKANPGAALEVTEHRVVGEEVLKASSSKPQPRKSAA